MSFLVDNMLAYSMPVWDVAKAMRLTGRKRLLYYESRMLCYEVCRRGTGVQREEL